MKKIDLQKTRYRLKRFFGKEELKVLMDVSHCNLRCSMCPRGGVSGLKNDAKGFMSLEFFKKIVDKFRNENVTIREIQMGNWGEPLLNNELPKMIRYLKAVWPPSFMGKPGSIGISTNLNYLKDAEELLDSGVDWIRVSVSGMTQDVYAKNHVGGDVEKVLQNILRLAEARDKKGLGVRLGIGFHDLVYNKKDAETAKKFCELHRLSFTLLDMYVPSVEDNVRFHEDKEKFSNIYRNFIDLDKELAAMKLVEKDVEKCQFRRSIIAINFDGRLYRCCAAYEEKHLIGYLFDKKIRDIPRIKSPVCAICARTPMSWR